MNSSAAGPEEIVEVAGALLDGENPTSTHRDDPEHWVAVYAELVDSTNRILLAARESVAQRNAADDHDMKLLEVEIAALEARSRFFASRLRWWANRGRELWAEPTETPVGS
jgi:hypothetical protein